MEPQNLNNRNPDDEHQEELCRHLLDANQQKLESIQSEMEHKRQALARLQEEIEELNSLGTAGKRKTKR